MDETATKPLKFMTAEEFQRLGFLQEVNRRFFHPYGIALGITKFPDGTMAIGPIFDDREDPEGIRFSDDQIDDEFVLRAIALGEEWDRRILTRHLKLGYGVQRAVHA